MRTNALSDNYYVFGCLQLLLTPLVIICETKVNTCSLLQVFIWHNNVKIDNIDVKIFDAKNFQIIKKKKKKKKKKLPINQTLCSR